MSVIDTRVRIWGLLTRFNLLRNFHPESLRVVVVHVDESREEEHECGSPEDYEQAINSRDDLNECSMYSEYNRHSACCESNLRQALYGIESVNPERLQTLGILTGFHEGPNTPHHPPQAVPLPEHILDVHVESVLLLLLLSPCPFRWTLLLACMAFLCGGGSVSCRLPSSLPTAAWEHDNGFAGIPV